jgi:hypothetical protein
MENRVKREKRQRYLSIMSALKKLLAAKVDKRCAKFPRLIIRAYFCALRKKQ